MKTAFLFPGQGSQYVGMGKDFYDSFAVAREVFDEADQILGMNLSKIIFEGPLDLLTQTKYAQLAIFVTSAAIIRTLEQERPDLKPNVCSGLSLGEYTALYASKRLGFKETLLLIKERASLMHEACEQTSGTMAAVLGLDALKIASAVEGMDGVWVANFNAPGQTVISGTNEAVEKSIPLLKAAGARRVIPLTVHGAFHSGLMQMAQDGLEKSVLKAPIQESEIAFVMNVPGDYALTNEEIKMNLIAQVTRPVSWEQGIEAMKAQGVERFIEIGCGKTLSGLNKKMGISTTIAFEKVSDLELNHATT